MQEQNWLLKGSWLNSPDSACLITIPTCNLHVEISRIFILHCSIPNNPDLGHKNSSWNVWNLVHTHYSGTRPIHTLFWCQILDEVMNYCEIPLSCMVCKVFPKTPVLKCPVTKPCVHGKTRTVGVYSQGNNWDANKTRIWKLCNTAVKHRKECHIQQIQKEWK